MASRLPIPQGYSAVAELFSSHPSLGVFRLFKDLNVGNLLDLQGEILHLKRDLQVYMHDEKYLSKCPEGDAHSAPIYHMKGAGHQSCPYHKRIWSKKLEIRQKLKEYNEAQVHFEHLHRRQKPAKRELQALREWLGTVGAGNNFLRGIEFHTWSEDAEDDFTCFSGHGRETDTFSRILEGPLLEWWDNTFGNRWQDPLSTAEAPLPRDLLGPLNYYPESQMFRIVYTTNTIFASLLPTVPVFLLYYISSPVARMGAIVVMTLIFNVLLTFLTNAKRSEIFAAATAFTAVQVVFLGTNNCNCT